MIVRKGCFTAATSFNSRSMLSFKVTWLVAAMTSRVGGLMVEEYEVEDKGSEVRDVDESK